MPTEPTHCLHCGAYVHPMNGEAIIRVLSDGTDVWCKKNMPPPGSLQGKNH